MAPKKKKLKTGSQVSSQKSGSKLNVSKVNEDEVPLIFRSLPKEVLDVASKIGLRTNVSREEIDTFVSSNTKDTGTDIGLLSYPCKTSINDIVEYGKVKRDKKHRLKKRKKLVKLSSKERKILFKVDKNSELRFDTFKDIHEVWEGYMSKITGDMRSEQDQLKLVRADYHGAHLSVFSSKNPALVGLSGIVVQETKLTFKIINESDKILGDYLFHVTILC